MSDEFEPVRYSFNETTWGVTGIGFDYSSTPELEDEVNLLKQIYSEISDWGDLSLFTAWGSFSQDHFDLKWHTVAEREELFLAYLYYVEQQPDHFNWDSRVAELSRKELKEKNPL